MLHTGDYKMTLETEAQVDESTQTNGAVPPKKARKPAVKKAAAPKAAVKKAAPAKKKAVKKAAKKAVKKAGPKKEGAKRGPRVADESTFKVVAKKEYREDSMKGKMWAALAGCKTVGEAKKKMAKFEEKEGRAAAIFQMWNRQGDVKVAA
jgi:hypothetical protein